MAGLMPFVEMWQAIQKGIQIADKLNKTGDAAASTWEQMGAAVHELHEAIGDAFNTALDMCGTEGQISIIEGMGYPAWRDATISAVNNSTDPTGSLMGACGYPDAVSEILSNSGGMLASAISDYRANGGPDKLKPPTSKVPSL